MRLPFGVSTPKFGTTVRDLDGFKSYNRFIILSSVTSNSIPNVLDMLFSLTPFGGTDTVMPTAKKTRVMVINTSEVFGSIHGLRDTRNRNVFIHHGQADCDVDYITGDTPIMFTDMDWDVIVDQPDEALSAPSYRGLTDVQLSYDMTSRGYEIRRDHGKNRDILIPTPEYYDEKDMVMLGGIDQSYGEHLIDLADYGNELSMDQYIGQLYKTTLNNLIDDHTKVYKLNIQIEHLTSQISGVDDTYGIDDMITEICSELKYALEHSGYSNAEIILSGKQGYNVTFEKLKTYLDLSPIEVRTNFMLLCNEVDRINDQYMCDQNGFSLLININHANIRVSVVDLISVINPSTGVTKTDSNVKYLGERLKYDNPGICEFHDAMIRDHS